jgi:pimeloyl-ACP methyl ester carboxylesterase
VVTKASASDDNRIHIKEKKALYFIEKGTGQPIVLIHGSLSDFRDWQFQIDKFAQDYRVISYSRRYAYPKQRIGNDDDDYDDDTIPNNVVDLVELIIKRLSLGRAHIIGHSYGAFIALYLAFEHPDLVKTLVLGEPPVISLLTANPQYTTDVDTIKENAFKYSLVQETLHRGETERAVRIFLDAVNDKEGFFYQLPSQARAMIMDNAKSLGGELASMSQHFTCEDAQKVGVPTLLIKGEQSPKFLHDIIDILASCLPNNEHITIPEESHELGRMEKHEVFNMHVLEFLSKHR